LQEGKNADSLRKKTRTNEEEYPSAELVGLNERTEDDETATATATTRVTPRSWWINEDLEVGAVVVRE